MASVLSEVLEICFSAEHGRPVGAVPEVRGPPQHTQHRLRLLYGLAFMMYLDMHLPTRRHPAARGTNKSIDVQRVYRFGEANLRTCGDRNRGKLFLAAQGAVGGMNSFPDREELSSRIQDTCIPEKLSLV